MHTKQDTKPLDQPFSAASKKPPGDLADFAFLDIADLCAAVRMSASWVHDEVRAGRLPQPLRFGPRCTRWRVADVRQYLINRAAEPQEEVRLIVRARAKKASEAAQAKRAKLATERTTGSGVQS